jgi:hypothetical protein
VQTSQRLDDVKAHVEVRIREARNQRLNRAGITPLAENQRGLYPEIGVVVIEKPDERRQHIDVADRQQVQRTTEHAEVLVLRPQRLHERRDDRSTLFGDRTDRRAPGPPILLPEQIGQSFDVLRQTSGKLAFTRDASGHVLNRDHDADDAPIIAQRTKGHVLVHVSEARHRVAGRTGDQMVVQGGREHLDAAVREHSIEGGENPAGGEIRNQLD